MNKIDESGHYTIQEAGMHVYAKYKVRPSEDILLEVCSKLITGREREIAEVGLRIKLDLDIP